MQNSWVFKRQKISTLFVIVVLAVSGVFASACTSQRVASSTASRNPSKFILRDEGLSQLSFVNLSDTNSNWHVPIPAGRDLQLVGNNRVLIGTGNGFEEHDITTGAKLFELTSYNGTVAARRLRNGNTLLVGVKWREKEGIVLVEVDKAGAVQRQIIYPGFNYVRLVRETEAGNFLVTANETIFEGKPDGTILWRATITGRKDPHAWQAVRLKNGQTLVSGGFKANFQVFGTDGKLVDSLVAPSDVRPYFFAGFQVLQNGNYVVTNWQGHGPTFGNSGDQILEFSPDGKLVWSWKQDPSKFSSLQGVIVLDGLDTNLLYLENGEGKLAPLQTR